jgi:hypothetical protein
MLIGAINLSFKKKKSNNVKEQGGGKEGRKEWRSWNGWGRNTAKRRKQDKNAKRIKARKRGSDEGVEAMVLHKVSSFKDDGIIDYFLFARTEGL